MTTSAVLRVPESLWDAVMADLLLTPDLERAAVGFAGVRRSDSGMQLLLRDCLHVPTNEYLVQLGHHLEVSPLFWARAAKRCRANNEAMVIIHSHPADPQRPRFSLSDDSGESSLVRKIRARVEVPIAAVVVSPGGVTARLTEGGAPMAMDVRAVGNIRRRRTADDNDAAFDRQLRALGKEGQSLLRSLKIGVVGAGGLGSHVVQQLVHLGVSEITVVDPDHVAATNLSRLIGASRRDVWLRRRKTRVARRLARRLGGKTQVGEIGEPLATPTAARQLLDCDLIFGCTDNQLSRTVLNTMAFQFYVPVIDLGVELQKAGAVGGGRVTWLAPGGACLWCMGVLDSETVRVEQLPPALRRDDEAHGYIRGVDEPAPAVVSINGVVASLGVTEMLARLTGFAGEALRSSLLLYRLADGAVRRTSPKPEPACPTCSVAGVLGAGDLIPPPWKA